MRTGPAAPAVVTRSDGAAPSSRRDGLWSHPMLLAITVGASSVEAAILLLVAPHSARGLAPQVVAAAPLGVLHDLRWLLVYHRSWLALAGGLLPPPRFPATGGT